MERAAPPYPTLWGSQSGAKRTRPNMTHADNESLLTLACIG